jgi:WD repeat-containing protein 42A
LSGSDCGHIFIWKKKDAKLVRLMVGDQHVVNQLEAHPHIPFLATCGIENNVKIWAPLGSDTPPLPSNFKEVPLPSVILMLLSFCFDLYF